jgi:hypothetical protein
MIKPSMKNIERLPNHMKQPLFQCRRSFPAARRLVSLPENGRNKSNWRHIPAAQDASTNYLARVRTAFTRRIRDASLLAWGPEIKGATGT